MEFKIEMRIFNPIGSIDTAGDFLQSSAENGQAVEAFFEKTQVDALTLATEDIRNVLVEAVLG